MGRLLLLAACLLGACAPLAAASRVEDAAGPPPPPQPPPPLPATLSEADEAELAAAAFRLTEKDDAQLLGGPFNYHESMPVITKRELAQAIKQAARNLRQLDEAPEPAPDALETGSAGWLANALLHRLAAPPDGSQANETRQALVAEESARLLARQHRLSRLQLLRGLPLISVEQTSLGAECTRSARAFACAPARFRSISGHCNNVQSADWGSAGSALARYAPARYLDQLGRPLPVWEGAGRARGHLLPSARAVSAALQGAAAAAAAGPGSVHAHMTTLLSFFGQFLFHDLAQVAQYRTPGRATPLGCCHHPKAGPEHPECMPVRLQLPARPSGFCLDYVRSAPASRPGCSLGPREQMNLVSAYLDGSTVYGSSEQQSRALRSFHGGRLRSSRLLLASGQQLELLPRHETGNASGAAAAAAHASPACEEMARTLPAGLQQDRTCFVAGDERVNENIGLSLMHTIWLREHNSLADQLAQLNGHWSDERLFEEARRLLVAQLQHIAYNEFLPAILDDDTYRRLNLSSLTQGYHYGYEPQANAGLANELASAVFPFILATMPEQLERYSERLEMLGTTSLAATFMDASDLLRRNRFAQYLMGMLSQNAHEPGAAALPAMMLSMMATGAAGGTASKRLRRAAAGTPSSNSSWPPEADVLALTIQQGRDHGLQGYLYWRDACRLRPQLRTWQDLGQVMPAEAVRLLRGLYAAPEHLDLYLGLLETPRPGATLGPTFVCLLARQFYQLKHGDRYWYENDLPSSAFAPAQLDEIRQTSLAKVLCRNGQASLSFVQPAPMLASDPYLNAYQYCSNRALARLNLEAWRETPQSAGDAPEVVATNRLARHAGDPRRLRRLVGDSVRRARRQLERLTHEQVRRRRSAAAAPRPEASASARAGYRYLAPRTRRQAQELGNQSLLLELATNELVRGLLHQGKDRERADSLQTELRDFLGSLESIQLENLLENANENSRLAEFIAGAGSSFLNSAQREALAKAGDSVLESASPPGGSPGGHVSAHCQDDERAFPCDHTSPYRSITGWCNNLQHPKWGQSFTAHNRLLENAYEDGLGKPRRLSRVLASQESGERLALPSARLISSTIHDDKSRLHARYSLALMQFGQFGVDHDLTRTPFSVALDGSLLDCSGCDARRTVHRDCMPIEVPEQDGHFHAPGAPHQRQRKCLHFVRSLNGQTGLGPRQQLNALTSYQDASNIYGSDNCEAKALRAFHGGRLNTSSYPSSASAAAAAAVKDLLPVTLANPECVTPGRVCFHAGDQRASEQPGLTAIHTVFMRLHNQLADRLAALNRHWQDERLYQEARKIVGAVMQRITYHEFLPRLLGLDYVGRFELLLKQVGYAPANHYDPTCSANILNEFSAAAFRMGHSLVRGAFPLLNRQYKPVGQSFQLRKAFFNSQRILGEPHLIDAILRGVVSSPVETLDNAISEELTNHLFERPKEPFSGMDLVALNVQRARDHGIAGYNSYRVRCNLTRARTFDELSGEIPAHLIKRLASVYAHVDDIDLFPGGMSELPVHGGLVGPTLGCIIGLQMSRLKRCDRFWHETGEPFVRFSAPQLAQVRRLTLAKVICQHSDAIDTIQRQAMDQPDAYLNPRVPCSSLPELDLGAWRELPHSCQVNKIKLELGQSKRVNPCKSCTCTREGPVCRTAKIDCLQAMKRLKLSSLMSDKSCLVQCAWVLDMQPAGAA